MSRISKADQALLFLNAVTGCLLIFGLPVAVDAIIRSSAPDVVLSDGGQLVSIVAVAALVGFMVNLGLYNAASYDYWLYASLMAFSLLLSGGLYAIAYILLTEEPGTGTPTPN